MPTKQSAASSTIVNITLPSPVPKLLLFSGFSDCYETEKPERILPGNEAIQNLPIIDTKHTTSWWDALFYSVTKTEIETRTSVSDYRGGGHGWTIQIKMANQFFISRQTSFLDFTGAQVFKSRFKAGASHRKSYKAFYPRSNSVTSAFYLVKFNHQTSSGLITCSKVAFQEERFPL